MSDTAYLLLGPETGAKEQELKEIRNRLRKSWGNDVEISRFYPFETENGEIFTALNNNSLFSDYRMVILSQAENISSSLAQSLADYLAHPVDTATLVIISSELSISQKIMKAVDKQHTRIFYDLLENQKSEWIRTHFRRMGISIASDAVDLLLDITEDNTQELRTICNQIGLFWQLMQKNSPIEEEDVQTYIYHSRQEDAFTLFPLIARGDFKQSLQALHSMLGSGDSQTPILLVSGLLWQFRRLLSITEAYTNGLSEGEAFLQATVLSKPSALRKPKDKTTYHTALQRYDLKAIRLIITALAEADLAVKEARDDQTELLLEQLLYRIIVKKGRPFHEAAFATLC